MVKFKQAGLALLLPLMAGVPALATEVGDSIQVPRSQVACVDVQQIPCSYCYGYGYDLPTKPRSYGKITLTTPIEGASSFTGTITSCAALDAILGADSTVGVQLIDKRVALVGDALKFVYIGVRLGGSKGPVLNGSAQLP